MTFTTDMQEAVRQCRIVLTCLRTPKLRVRFMELLAAQDSERQVNPVSDSSLDKPFAQVDWLNTAYDDGAQESLGRQIDRLDDVLGPNTILYADLIDGLPVNWEERKQLIGTICQRVFASLPAQRKWLTEAEYNARLGMLVTDPVTVRRYSIDMGLVRRDSQGSRYWLNQVSG